MPTPKFTGNAPAIAQVVTLTLGGTWEATDVILLTINSKTVSITAGSTVLATIATTIADAWNALSSSIYPEFDEITAEANSAVVTLTSDTEGVPFILTSSTTEVGGGAADAQTLVQATATAASGPEFFNLAANWDGGAVPTTGDDAVIENYTGSIKYGFADSGNTLASLTIRNLVGDVSLPTENAAGEYTEYRDTYLSLRATTITIDNVRGRVKLNTVGVQTTINQLSGDGLTDGVPATLWKGTHASNAANILGGSFGAAFYAGEVANLSGGLRIDDMDSVIIGAGVTLAGTITHSGDSGTLTLRNSPTALTKTGQADTIQEAGAPTTLNCWNGTYDSKSTSTITAANIGPEGTYSSDDDPRAKTITAMTLYPGATVNAPHGNLVVTNGFTPAACRLDDVNVDLGVGRTYVPS